MKLTVQAVPVAVAAPLPAKTEQKEGDSVTLKMSLTKPGSKMVWTKDGKELKPSDDVKMTLDSTSATLTISKSSSASSGVYKVDVDGATSESRVDVAIVPVAIAKPLVTKAELEGNQAVLQIETNKPAQKVEWKKDGAVLSSNSRLQITSVDGVVHKLVVDDLQVKDAGEYVVSVDGVESKANLTVKEATVELKKKLALSHTAKEGEALNLAVELNKIPADLKWVVNGKEVSSTDSRRRVIIDGKTAKLEISATESSDAGEIKLVGDGGKISTATKITIKDKPIELVRKIEYTKATEKGEATFECETNKEAETVKWLKGTKAIVADDRFIVKSDGKKHTLTIKNISMDDFGEYTFQIGTTRCAAKLEVKEAPLDIVKGLEQTEVKEGSTATLVCDVSKTGSKVTWTKNGKELKSDWRVSWSCEGTTHKLVVKSATAEDAGLYEVKAGAKTSSAKLIIKETPIEFTQKLVETEADEGKTVTLECAASKPGVKVTWKKDGKVLSESDRISTSSRVSKMSLTIKKVTAQDAGQYEAVFPGGESTSARLTVAESSVKIKSQLKDVTVIERSDATFQIEVSSTSAIVKWLKNGKTVYPTIRTIIESDGLVRRLTIKEAKVEDEGRYSVETNADSSSARLTLRANESPKIGKTIGVKSEVTTPATPTVASAPSAKAPTASSSTITAAAAAATSAASAVASVQPSLAAATATTSATATAATKVGTAASSAGATGSSAALAALSAATAGSSTSTSGSSAALAALSAATAGSSAATASSSASAVSSSAALAASSAATSGTSAAASTSSSTAAAATAPAAPATKVSAALRKPAFVSKLKEVTAVEGQKAQMEILFRGQPEPKVTWLHDGQPIQLSARRAIVSTPNKSSMVIEKCTAEDAGVYSVTATNDAGSIDCQASLMVDGAAPSQIQKRSIPSFTQRFSDVDIKEGYTARFDCVVEGNPAPVIKWFFDKSMLVGRLFSGGRIKISTEPGGKQVLVIKDAGLEDEGEYSCKAASAEGNAACSANLFIMESDSHMIARASRSRSASTTASGFTSRESSVGYSASSTSSTLRSAGLPDFGAAVAAKTAGTTAAAVSVAAKNTEKSDTGVAPSFLSTIKDCHVATGSAATFDVKVKGTPRPIVNWYKSGQRLHRGAKYQIVANTESGDYSLKIENVQSTDKGEYTCSATNVAGVTNCAGELSVEEVSTSAAPTSSTSASAAASAFRMRKLEAPKAVREQPTISNLTANKVSLHWQPPPDHEQYGEISYCVEFKESHSHTWRKVAGGLRETRFDAKNLDVSRQYYFRVRVENEFGMSDPSPAVNTFKQIAVTASPDRELMGETAASDFGVTSSSSIRRTRMSFEEMRQRRAARTDQAPKFEGPQRDIQYGVTGHTAKIAVSVAAYPTPEFKWYHGGRELPLGGRYKSETNHLGVTTLSIENFKGAEEGGEYTVLASTPQGKAEKKIYLDLADPPVFIEPLQEKTIASKSFLKLVCRVDGIPYPEVRWSKDWKPITDSVRTKISHEEPDIWTLTIDGAVSHDSGLYTVSSTNIAGEVTCSVRVFVTDQYEKVFGKYSSNTRRVKFEKRKRFEHTFEIQDEIGRGSQAIVYEAIDKKTNSTVCVKEVELPRYDDEKVEDIKLGAELQYEMTHTNICSLIEVYQTRFRLLMIQEQLHGGELFPYLMSKAKLTESEVVFYIKQLLEAIKHMHDLNVVHLDLKPENLHLSTGDATTLKLLGFRRARRVTPGERVVVEEPPKGAEEFAPPEVLLKTPVSKQSDVWSIGAIVYTLLAGKSPFFSESEPNTAFRVKTCQWTLDSELFSGSSASAKDFISNCLVLDPRKRMTIEQCLTHPWLKLHSAKGYGRRVQSHRVANFVSRRKWMRQLTLAKNPENESPRSSPEPSELAAERKRGSGFGLEDSGKDEPTYTWRSNYTKSGLDTFLVPIRDHQLSLRLREWNRISSYQSVESLESICQVKERRKISDASRDFTPDELRSYRFHRYHRGVSPGSKRSRSVPAGLLNVEDHPEKSCVVREGFSPIFKEKIKETTIQVGETVTLRCQVVGNPLPKLSWYRNDEVITSGGRISIRQTEDGKTSLTIQRARANDVGVYRVTARNRVGHMTCRSRIRLGDIPAKPGKPVIPQVSCREAYVAWEAPETDGNSFIMSYKIDYRRDYEDTWHSAGYTLDEAYLCTGLEPDKIYRFRVSCMNKYGISPFSYSSSEIRTERSGTASISIDEEKRRRLLQQQKSATRIASGVQSRMTPTTTADDYSVGEEVKLKKADPTAAYKMEGEIARGARCIIRKVVDRNTYRKLVGKVRRFPRQGKANEEGEALNEFELLKIVNHERIARLHDAYLWNDLHMLVIEGCAGGDLLDFFTLRKKYNEDHVAQIVRQLSDGLQFLHYLGIAHLHLTPGNVLLKSRTGIEVKLVDFTCARQLGQEGDDIDAVGTLEFMAPEVASFETVRLSADVWGLGALTFFMLSATSPFRGETEKETLNNLTFVRYMTKFLYDEVTSEALNFIQATLRRIPSKRPSIDELLEHTWLANRREMTNKREAAVFSANRMVSFKDEWRFRREEQSRVLPEEVVTAFGAPNVKSDSLSSLES